MKASATLSTWLPSLRCPRCLGKLSFQEPTTTPGFLCSECCTSYPLISGVPSLIIRERADAVADYCRQYDTLRLQEGWASTLKDFYASLPFRDISGRHSGDWKLRLRSFRFLQRWIARRFPGKRLRILDLGAGSCWMSRELAAHHDILAVDLNAGPHGLGAISETDRRFVAIQAELENMPFASQAFDLVIANASLHYARDAGAALASIRPLLRPDGRLIVLDSPTYDTPSSLAQAKIRTQTYCTRLGFPGLAERYNGLVRSLFLENKDYRFTCLRRDFTPLRTLRNWWLKLRHESSQVQFPVWLGEPRVSSDVQKLHATETHSAFHFLCMLIALIATSCTDKPTDALPAGTPELRSMRIEQLPENFLAAQITLHTINTHRAAIEVLDGDRRVLLTPFFPPDGDSIVLPLVGLPPSRTYRMNALLADAGSGVVRAGSVDYTTPLLPSLPSIPPLLVTHTDSPSVRFVMLGIAPARNGQSVAMIIDYNASPVWVRPFNDAVVDFQRQPSGTFTAWTSSPLGSSCFHEMDLAGRLLRTFSAVSPDGTGPHELRVAEGRYVMFGIEFRTMDLSPFNGHPAARVRGTFVEIQTVGVYRWRWSPFDHFSVADAAADVSLTEPNVNPWHGNAIDIDHDGHLLVSFRNSDEITKINSGSGQIIWRLGGKRGQFTFLNDPLNGFSHQHAVRRLQNGNILLFDNGNGHSPPTSRAVEYRIDENRRTAELVWEYRPNPPLYGFALGFAQRLANGHTLICFGTAQTIIEVDRAGRKRWEVTINEPNRYAYRAIAIDSLYE